MFETLIQDLRYSIRSLFARPGFVFAAVATPDGNPFTMMMLALPIMVLLMVVMAIAWLNDRRSGRPSLGDTLADDEASTIDDVTPID